MDALFPSTDPALFWSQVKCPVLALNGDKDLQVSHQVNLPAIRSALRSGGNRKVKTVILPRPESPVPAFGNRLTDEYVTIEETFSPEAMELITSWIRKTMKMR